MNPPATPNDSRVDRLEQLIREMADDIRNTDIALFQISQCLDWNQARALLQPLIARMESRRREESDRITNILRKELLDVYAKPPEQRRIAGRP